MSKTILFIGYDDVQAIDLIGPWEVFILWRNLIDPKLQLYIVSETGEPFSMGNELTLPAHMSFAKAPKADIVVVPGGQGRIKQTNNKTLLNFIQTQYQSCEYIASVCTGAFLLQAAGILQGKKCTTYWRALPEFTRLLGVTVSEERIVRDGKVWTAGGLSSGIDLALAIIAEIAGDEIAGRIQLAFEYFPLDKVYATEENTKQLPPYNNSDHEVIVPRYIKKII